MELIFKTKNHAWSLSIRGIRNVSMFDWSLMSDRFEELIDDATLEVIEPHNARYGEAQKLVDDEVTKGMTVIYNSNWRLSGDNTLPTSHEPL